MDNKTFLAIIIGALIIGGFIYFGLSRSQSDRGSSTVLPSGQKSVVVIAPSAQNLTPNSPTNAGLSQNKSLTTNAAVCGAADQTIVTKVIDGDTVVVEGGWHIRLLGMDADENGYPCYEPAKTRLEGLVLAKQVILEKDISDVDQYGRCLRYIFVGGTNIDVQLVKEGLVVARFYEPDVKYKAEISAAEQYAQQNKIGCKWSGVQQTK